MDQHGRTYRHTGVILAAGRGTRITPLSGLVPKPLLLVGNKPIMQYQIEAMRGAGIADVIVVVGQLGERIHEYFGDGSRLGVRLRYVVDGAPAGIASSLALAAPYIEDGCTVFLGDIYLELERLGECVSLLEKGATEGVILVKHEPDPEAIKRNFSVELGEGWTVTRVVEKPKNLVNDLKGCGVYLFGRRIFDAIARTPRSSLRNEYELTDAIQTLIEMGADVRASAAVRYDVNVTYPVDLLTCNLGWLRRQGLRSLCAPGVRLLPGTCLEEAIIGEHVEVATPMTIRQTVILPGSHVASDSGLIEKSLVYPGGQLSFDAEV